jgi:hypothetical protein
MKKPQIINKHEYSVANLINQQAMQRVTNGSEGRMLMQW